MKESVLVFGGGSWAHLQVAKGQSSFFKEKDSYVVLRF